MTYDFKYLRPYPPQYPKYPPYANVEEYMEHYFFNYYKNNIQEFEKINRQYLPVFWTTLYNDNPPVNVVEYISALPRDGKYFTINQHDNGILFPIPKDTIVFSASERGLGQIIPIPLISSRIPDNKEIVEKDIFCSFVGTLTHKIRLQLYENYLNNSKFYFSKARHWLPTIDESQFIEFKNITKRSRYTLCPRGNVSQSFRIYETMQLNSIPVIVTDYFLYPFKEYVKWEEFAVIINSKDVQHVEEILDSYSDQDYQTLLEKGQQIYKEYFTLEKMCENIKKYLINV
jgi:hypothetical protein